MHRVCRLQLGQQQNPTSGQQTINMQQHYTFCVCIYIICVYLHFLTFSIYVYLHATFCKSLVKVKVRAACCSCFWSIWEYWKFITVQFSKYSCVASFLTWLHLPTRSLSIYSTTLFLQFIYLDHLCTFIYFLRNTHIHIPSVPFYYPLFLFINCFRDFYWDQINIVNTFIYN